MPYYSTVFISEETLSGKANMVVSFLAIFGHLARLFVVRFLRLRAAAVTAYHGSPSQFWFPSLLMRVWDYQPMFIVGTQRYWFLRLFMCSQAFLFYANPAFCQRHYSLSIIPISCAFGHTLRWITCSLGRTSLVSSF